MRIMYASADHGIPVFGNKGASIHIQEMVKAFGELGHETTLLTARLGDGPPTLPGEVRKIRSSAPSHLDGQSAGHNENCRSAKETRYLSIADAIEHAIIAEHRREPLDLIYERYSLWSAAGTRAAKRLSVPCILEVNAPLLAEQRQYRKLVLDGQARAIEREVLTTVDHIFAVSDEVAEYVIRQGASPNRVEVQPNGVNTDVFSPIGDVAKIDGIGDELVIGFCGSLKPWHGVEDLLQAYASILQTAPTSKLLIVGDGPLSEWMKGFIAGARLEDNVVLLGWRPYEELPSLIRRMDIATAPYPDLEDFYFSPLKLFEYMACGKAVVAADIGQIRSVLKNNQNGLLNRPGDCDHLADLIGGLMEQPALRQRLGAHAAQSVAERSWRNNALRVTSMVERNFDANTEQRASP